MPTSRLSAAILWKDYQTDTAKADRTYARQPIVISGVVTSQGSGAVGDRYRFFGQPDQVGIRANLLDEQADSLLKSVPPDKRVTLKCFVEGLSVNVVLKSCVKP